MSTYDNFLSMLIRQGDNISLNKNLLDGLTTNPYLARTLVNMKNFYKIIFRIDADNLALIVKRLDGDDLKKFVNKLNDNSLKALASKLDDTLLETVFDNLDDARKSVLRGDPDLAGRLPGAGTVDDVAKEAANVVEEVAKTVDDVAEEAANNFHKFATRNPIQAKRMFEANPEKYDELIFNGKLSNKQMSEIGDALGETFWGRYMGPNSWCAKNAEKCVVGLAGAGVGAYFLGDHIKSKEDEKNCRNDCFPKNWDEYVVVGIDKELLEYQTWDDDDKPVCTASMVTDEKPHICNEYCKTACKNESAIEGIVSDTKELASQGLLDLAEELGKLVEEASSVAGDAGGNFLKGIFGEYWWAWLIGIFVVIILGGVAIKRLMG